MSKEDMISQRTRELIEDGETSINPHSGVIERGTLSELISYYRAVWSQVDADGLPEAFEDTEIYRRLMSKYATERHTRLLDEDAAWSAAYYLGSEKTGLDASELTASQVLRQLMDTPNEYFAAVVYGANNMGKSTTCGTLAHEWKNKYSESSWYEDAYVVSNAEASIVDRVVTSMSEFAEVVLGDADYFYSRYKEGTPPELSRDGSRKLFWLQEGSTWLNASQYHHEVSVQFKQWANRFAKFHTDFITEAHNPVSVHKFFRRPDNVTVYLKKEDRKTVSLYREIGQNAGLPKEESHIVTLENLSKSAVDVDPDDPAPWSWDYNV